MNTSRFCASCTRTPGPTRSWRRSTTISSGERNSTIALGLSWPERLTDVETPVDWTQAQDWRFEPLDDEAFPAVRLAQQVGAAGGTHPAVYNAANEVGVDAFHEGACRFTDIVDTIAEVVDRHDDAAFDAHSVDGVLGADAWARDEARSILRG